MAREKKINTNIKTKAELRASLQGLANLMNKYNSTYKGDDGIISEAVEESVRQSLGGTYEKKHKIDGGYTTIRTGDLFNVLFKQNDEGKWMLNTTQKNTKEKQAFNDALDEHLKNITKPKAKKGLDSIINTIQNTPSVNSMIKAVKEDLAAGYGFTDEARDNKNVWKYDTQKAFIEAELEKNPNANKKDLRALYKTERQEGIVREMTARAKFAITASYGSEDIDNMFNDMSEILEGIGDSSINNDLKNLLWHKGRTLTTEDIARLEAAYLSLQG